MKRIVLLIAVMATLMAAPAFASSVPYPGLKTDAVHTELSGAQAQLWAKAALKALHAPQTRANVTTMVLWFANEGEPHDLNNPLNLITHYGGSYDQDATGDPQIQAYPSPQDFPPAFNREMLKGGPDENGDYSYIVAALRSGHGFTENTSWGIENDLSLYSGGGYDTVPAWYCQPRC